MNFKLVALLSSSVAMLALVISLIACGGSGVNATGSSATNPEVPSIPIASQSEADDAATSSTARIESVTNREETTTGRQGGTESDESNDVTTASSAIDEPVDPGALLNTAALRTATTDGAHVDIKCSIRLTDGSGQTTDFTTTVLWRRVGGNCIQSGDSGYAWVDGILYVPGVGVKIDGMTDEQTAWVYENMIAPGLLPFEPDSVRTLNVSDRVVTASGIRDQYLSALLASLGLEYAENVTLNESSGSITLNADTTLASATYRVVLTYAAEGDTYKEEVDFTCSYRYDSKETVEIPDGAGSCSSVSFRDVFDIDLPDQTETESTKDPSAEEDVRYVTVANLNVRSSPDFSSEKNVVGYLHKGDRVVILQDYGLYARIEFKGKECYIGTKYLSVEKPD